MDIRKSRETIIKTRQFNDRLCKHIGDAANANTYMPREQKKALFVAAAMAVSCLLSGCRMIALPGQEPFGEQTYSDEQAWLVYQNVCRDIEQMEFSDWDGYIMNLDETTVSHDFYWTEEYTVAWHEGAGKEYLWYQGRLYCWDGETIAYRDMDWTELQADDYMAQQRELACELLTRDPETVKYKYTPMASNEQYLLTVKYPEMVWDDQTWQFPKLSVRLDEDRKFSSFTVGWQEGTRRSIDVSYFPWEGSTNLQAERAVWSFAHELGLIEEGVPAISTQQDDREWCQSMIAGINFDSLLEGAVYQDDLTFPVPPKRDTSQTISGSLAPAGGREKVQKLVLARVWHILC